MNSYVYVFFTLNVFFYFMLSWLTNEVEYNNDKECEESKLEVSWDSIELRRADKNTCRTKLIIATMIRYIEVYNAHFVSSDKFKTHVSRKYSRY